MTRALLLVSLLWAWHCPDQGSERVPATWEAGPALGCPHAPRRPAWYLLTPAHRRVVPKAGFRQGEARPRPRLLVRMRCTGLWLLPAVPVAVRTMGYVLDVEEERCGG